MVKLFSVLVVDTNDRFLRKIEIGLGELENSKTRQV